MMAEGRVGRGGPFTGLGAFSESPLSKGITGSDFCLASYA